MYECCLHTLRIYLLRLGWIGEAGDVVYEPIPEIRSRLKCRGQVLATTRKVWYEVTLKEIGYGGMRNAERGTRNDAYCIADALMYADGKPIVEMTDMSVRLTGLTREKVERLWSSISPSGGRKPPESGVARSGVYNQGANAPRSGNAVFDTDRITEFAIGKPSQAFGDKYRVFDDERKIARLPGPPFQFLDRIVSIENCEQWKLAAGGTIVAEYDVPPDAWYFAANRQRSMPFAVLLETALQPCGWLAAYLGSALTSDIDLSFRNLGGKATQFQAVTPDSGTLSTTVKITAVSQSGGMIIQHYEFDLRCRDESVYRGTTYFGFFSKSSLANQIGIRDANQYQPTADELSHAESLAILHAAPFPSDDFRMIDRVPIYIPDGGPHRLGFLRGTIDVDPSLWFFQAHFYQDPVWPGSLGLESFLQLLKVYAVKRWGAASSDEQREMFLLPRLGGEGGRRPDEGVITDAALQKSPHPGPLPRSGEEGTDQKQPSTLNFQTVALRAPHEWIYRGQVIPSDKTVTVDVVITAVDDAKRLAAASGFLSVDGRVIYQMIDFTVQLM
jgi:3-hydroxymyristoyl/3-hydroxydecanoyl-(acyl carrier protein) dehydratase